jgi:hypothetical protein
LEAIEKAFRKIGSRVKFGLLVPQRTRRFNQEKGRWELIVSDNHLSVGLVHDKKGDFFEVNTRGEVDLQVMQVSKHTPHLLLFARDKSDARYRYLCGRDERDWFAAAVPEAVSSVVDAMEALKPEHVERA